MGSPEVSGDAGGQSEQLAQVLVLPGAQAEPPGRESGKAKGHDRGWVSMAALTVVILMAVAALGWRALGGQVFVMETGSMCPKICVGSLVADEPLKGPLHRGELITFHPPSLGTEVYTHEVYRIFANGAIQTHGVAETGHDPWLISRADITGMTVLHLPGLGWLLKDLPVLAVGVLCWVAVRRKIARAVRRGWDRLWMTALTVIPLWTLHPLIDGAVVASSQISHHRVSVTLVNTGLLPASFGTPSGIVARHVASGALAHVTMRVHHGSPLLHETAALPWWGWAVIAAVVASPALGYIWYILRHSESGGPATAE
jgi:hypothetical protein